MLTLRPRDEQPDELVLLYLPLSFSLPASFTVSEKTNMAIPKKLYNLKCFPQSD